MTDSQADSQATNAAQNGTTRDYLPAERQDMILSLLTRQSVATVAELSKLLNTTEITVRRDLTVLSKAGLLKRIRGGAMSVGDATNGNALTSEQPTAALSQRTANGDIIIKPAPRNIQLGDDQPAIGVMLPEPSFFWPGVIDHMRTSASRLGLRIVTRESTYEGDVREDDILDELSGDSTLCGLIVAPNSMPECGRHTWDWIAGTDTPVVVIERDLPLLSTHYVDSVRTNHPYGVRKAAVHFLEHGHTRIGAAFTTTPTSELIQEGWQQIVDESDAIECPFVISGIQPYNTKGVNNIVDTILDSNVTAMLVHSDYLAIAIAQTLERRGKRVPNDISMISIDGFATPSSRPLTVLRSPDKDLAEAAIDTLIHRIQNPDSATRHIYVDPTLVDRGSVIDIR
jgi:DNA-binding LacI/PurR family transcriptional regulator